MKIYLASRYSRFREMQKYRTHLQSIGHQITCRWINGSHQIDDAGLSSQAKEAERIRFAQEDYSDLVAADCIISFTEAPRSSNSRGGRHVEHGMALALGKRTIVVGHRENVFHCLPQVEFYLTWEDLVNVVFPSATPQYSQGEHVEVLRAAGVHIEGDGSEHGGVLRAAGVPGY